MNKLSSLASTLLVTKQDSPATTSAQVPRAGVCDLVSASPSVKLILVSAPAGFGKTTTMVQCRKQLGESGLDTGWMTIDSADNDTSRFLICLAAVVREMTTDQPVRANEFTLAAPHSLDHLALDIMNRLASHSAPFALFLDDVDLLQEPTVLRLLREIIGHLPRRGQLIIGSRRVPDLGLSRLRARGQLLEIDAQSLRFSIGETMEFFTQCRGLPLREEDLLQLHRKTEGWITALWLASLALERRADRSEFIRHFSGSDRAVAGYLAEDVLTNQPPYMRDFLLRTSILRHLSESLCNALLPQTDSAAILTQLEEAGLFLAPVEGAQKAYRYHNLFAEFLRMQLSREMPEEFTRLHWAASQWYESQGRIVPAIDHALEGGNYEHVVRLLTQYGESLLHEGRMRLLARWFAAIPENFLRTSALLQVIHVWALCFTRGPREAMTLLENYGCAESGDPKVLAYVFALRPVLLAIMDRFEEAHEFGREALSRMPTTNAFAESVLANQMAYMFAIMGHYQESHKLLDTARSYQGQSSSIFNTLYSETVEGMIDLEKGQLRQATARFRMAVSSSHTGSDRYRDGNAWPGVLYAAALYEASDLEQAEHLLHVYVPLAKDVGLPDHMILGYTLLSRIAFYRGDIDQSFRCLGELEYLGYHRQVPRVVASAKLERARVLLMQGNKLGAKEELQRANNHDVWERVQPLRLLAHDLEYFAMSQMRWAILSGDTSEVLPRLESAIAEATTTLRHRRALKLRLLQSLALKQSGDIQAALATINDVLKLACGEGFIRLIVDEGESIGLLVRQLSQKLHEDGLDRKNPVFGEYLQRILATFGPLPVMDTDFSRTPASKGLAEHLTVKERRILLLLADGYSNNALAEKQSISESTVRTHLRNINAKLSAQNRTQAVSIARRLGLIQ